MNILTADGRILKCRRYSRIKLDIGIAELVHIDALTVERQQLGFDLLGINAIRELGWVHITSLADPVGGNWCVDGHEMNVWVDVISVATEILEVNGNVIKDASWQCPAGFTKHINLDKLNGRIKGVNLTLQ